MAKTIRAIVSFTMESPGKLDVAKEGAEAWAKANVLELRRIGGKNVKALVSVEEVEEAQ